MIQSQLLINLEVRWDSRDGDFYTGLAFLPVEETEQVIKDHRLTVKYDPAGIKVFAPVIGVSALGIRSGKIPEASAGKLRKINAYGTYVMQVDRGSAADDAGLKAADYIYGINGQQTSNSKTLSDLIAAYRIGDKVSLLIRRNGRKRTRRLTFRGELLVPIKAKKKLRWLLKPHTKGFFDLVNLPYKNGLYFMSNWAGDPVRFNKFLKRSVYGEMERKVYKRHEGFCFGFIGRKYSSVHHLNEGKNKIELNPPPVQRVRKEDFTIAPVFAGAMTEAEEVAKITKYPRHRKNRYEDEDNDRVIEVTAQTDTSITIDYPVAVKGYNYAFAVLDLYFIDKLKGLSLDEAENTSMPTTHYYLILKRQAEVKK